MGALGNYARVPLWVPFMGALGSAARVPPAPSTIAYNAPGVHFTPNYTWGDFGPTAAIVEAGRGKGQ